MLATREEVSSLARSLYGVEPGPMRGVLQTSAVARRGDGLVFMRIGEHSPRSERDWHALQLARARVEAILVTGSVLRAEPELRYDLDGAGFHAWRGDVRPPWLLVLTGSGELPLEHPIWESWARPLVFTGPDATLRLPARVEVVRRESPSARAAITFLERERGCASVSIEAGPSVVLPLYDEPCVIDELMLSVFEGELDPRAVGGAFLSEAELARRMQRVSEVEAREPSGPWRFRRYIRRAAP